MQDLHEELIRLEGLVGEEFQDLSDKLKPKIIACGDIAIAQKYRTIINNRIHQRHQTDRKELFNKSNERKQKLNLKQTLIMLEEELEKSNTSKQQLAHSNVTKIKNDFNTMDDTLLSSKSLLKELVGKDQKDRLILFAGLAVFVSTIIYIFIKRI